MGARVVRWLPGLLCNLDERCRCIQSLLGRGPCLLDDLVLIDEERALFLDMVLDSLMGGCGRVAERFGLLVELRSTLPVLLPVVASLCSDIWGTGSSRRCHGCDIRSSSALWPDEQPAIGLSLLLTATGQCCQAGVGRVRYGCYRA